MYLVFDTETDGLPRTWAAPASDTRNWPRVVQLGWQVHDARGKLLSATSHIVRPEGFEIPSEAVKVHGISTARAKREGKPLREVLAAFTAAVDDAGVVVAHNLRFDDNVVSAEYIRLGLDYSLENKTCFCTMTATTDICRIPGPRGFKWPTLGELHRVLFGEDFADAHDAAVDVAACARCFFELKKRRAIRLDGRTR